MRNKLIYNPAGKEVRIRLDGSKSISNRALLIQALAEQEFELHGLSTSEDTETMQKALIATQDEINVGPAGTTFRFLCALLSQQEGKTTVLTGSKRMLERPIGPLVKALQDLGANITYMGKEGFPPLKICGTKLQGKQVSIRADISSQFISALMMLGPKLQHGLEILLKGEMVSYSYLRLTKEIMQHFGVIVKEERLSDSVYKFVIPPAKYKSAPLEIEADWSAASYYYAIVALSENQALRLQGLQQDSFQGDSAIVKIARAFGVTSCFDQSGLLLSFDPSLRKQSIDWDFTNCPDIAQTVAAAAAGLGINCSMRGLQTLQRKETDRTAALATELSKFGARFYEEGPAWKLDSSQVNLHHQNVTFNTYHDHRMAMAFAPLAAKLKDIEIENPKVVGKSYPAYWQDIANLGFHLESLD